MFAHLPEELCLHILSYVPVKTLVLTVPHVCRAAYSSVKKLFWSRTYQDDLLARLNVSFFFQTWHVDETSPSKRIYDPPTEMVRAELPCIVEPSVGDETPCTIDQRPRKRRRHDGCLSRLPIRFYTRQHYEISDTCVLAWHDAEYRAVAKITVHKTVSLTDSATMSGTTRVQMTKMETTNPSIEQCYEGDLDLHKLLARLPDVAEDGPRYSTEYTYPLSHSVSGFHVRVSAEQWDAYRAGVAPHPDAHAFVYAEVPLPPSELPRRRERGWIRYNRFMVPQMKLDGVWKIGRSYGNELLNSAEATY